VVARVARFEGVNVEVAKQTMDEADAIIRPLVEGLQGYSGHLELASEAGGYLSITFFESADDAASAERVFDEEMPRQLGELFGSWGGTRVDVTRYQVVGDERS